MAQFNCPVCGQGFEQRSRYKRHMQTSHPQQAPSAADMEKLLSGIEFPKNRDEILRYAGQQAANDDAVDLLEQLPEQEYRDAAEVARALGAVKSEEEKPQHQPSKRGGRRAVESPRRPSAAQVASAFAGVSLPLSAAELREYAQQNASEDIQKLISRLPEGSYEDMADIASALAAAKDDDGKN